MTMILIDYKDSRPIYEQVVDKFRLLILNGALKSEDKMPSVRALAMDLSINPNTIQKAYGELERQGYIYTVKGRGNFVSEVSKLKEDYRQEVFLKLDGVCDTAFRIGMKGGELIDRIRENEDKRGDEGQ
jgi:GntR family transcriptional regulator